MSRKQTLILILGLAVLGIICGAVWWFQSPQTLKDLAFDVNERFGYTIYLPEGDSMVPYLVLTNDYNGHCLLLRKHLLDEQIIYNYTDYVPDEEDGGFIPPAYYENSVVDQYLCNEFLQTLPSLRDRIVDSDVIITDKKSIGSTGKGTLTIQRKVFLLSYTELTGRDSIVPVVEGIGLKSFTQRDAYALKFRIATTASGQAYGWWLRTPTTWYRSSACMVTADGYLGDTSIGLADPYNVRTNWVRPAFCLPGDMAIVEADMDGERVYVLELDSDE